ncbi:MAG TPA: hypothetical protein VI756_12250 [Blastocatellia bacterium]
MNKYVWNRGRYVGNPYRVYAFRFASRLVLKKEFSSSLLCGRSELYMYNKYRSSRHFQNAPVTRPVSSKVFVWLSAIAIVGTLLSCSFLISARRHFQAVELGYQKESLRGQAAALEKRVESLELERDRAGSVGEIKKRADHVGMIQDTHVRRPGS